MITTGDKVTVRKGYGYDRFNPEGFKRSDGTVTGVVTHVTDQAAWIRLADGTVAETLTSGLEKE